MLNNIRASCSHVRHMAFMFHYLEIKYYAISIIGFAMHAGAHI